MIITNSRNGEIWLLLNTVFSSIIRKQREPQTTTVTTACQARLWIKNFQNTSHRVTVAKCKENGWQAFLRLNARALKGKITTYTIINFIVTHAYSCKENKRKNTERITDHILNLKKTAFSPQPFNDFDGYLQCESNQSSSVMPIITGHR